MQKGVSALRADFTVFSSPDRLSKAFSLAKDGSLVKVSGVNYFRGTAARRSLTGATAPELLGQLAQLLPGLDSRQAIGLGTHVSGQPAQVMTSTSQRKQGLADDDAAARTKAEFVYDTHGRLLMLDRDDGDGCRAFLMKLASSLANVATLTVPSASARVLNGGKAVGRGEHAYLILSRPGAHQEVLDALMRLAWHRDLGWIFVNRIGALYSRGVFDVMVGGSERLIYEGAPTVAAPLTLAKKRPGRIEGELVLDVDALVAEADAAISPDEMAAKVATAKASPEVMGKQGPLRAAHRKQLLADYKARGVGSEKAQRFAKLVDEGVRQAIKSGADEPTFILTAADVVVAADGREISVGEILADPNAFFGLPIADPFEGPDYGATTAMIHPEPREGVQIKSFAHGGCRYLLTAGEAYDGDEEFTLDVPSLAYNHFRAYLPDHSYIDMHHPDGEPWSQSGIAAHLPPLVYWQDGKQKEMPAWRWLDKHRPTTGLTWFPGKPPIIRNVVLTAGSIRAAPGRVLVNVYLPPTIKLGDAAQATPWLDHGRLLYGDEIEHIWDCFAFKTQHPGVKINHGIVLGGVEGIGKDLLLAPFIEAVGEWNCGEASPSEIVDSGFNGYRQAVVVRVNEARDLGSAKAWAATDASKTLLAAPPNILVANEKYQKKRRIPNIVFGVITTNHQRTGLYLEPTDRRHYVASTSISPADLPGGDEAYFKRLGSWLEGGGYGHVAAWLHQRDLAHFNPKARPERTPGWFAMVDSARPPEDAALADAVAQVVEAHGQAVFTKAMLVNAATGDLQRLLLDRGSHRSLPLMLDRLGYKQVRNPHQADGLFSFQVPTIGTTKTKQMRMAIYGDVKLAPGEALELARTMALKRAKQ